jgi:excisionase family DNA binding protein
LPGLWLKPVQQDVICYMLLQHELLDLTRLPFDDRLTRDSDKDCACVDDLLTTRQLQELLQVDRITIYRMLHDGRLRGFKVGGQWRFSRQEIEAWLQEKRVGREVGEEPIHTAGETGPSRVLSTSCVQAVQGVCAEALGIGMITVEPDGTPFTEISNSCDFCNIILSSEVGKRQCAAAWRSAGDGKAHQCHAGLYCVGASVEVGDRVVAVTAACQFTILASDGAEPSWRTSLAGLSAGLDLSEKDLRAAAESVRLRTDENLQRTARLVARVADTFAEIGEERLSLLSRLEHIAEVSKV